ncbi:MAG: MaoC family dehydratase N-terminal domain-containing protein [Firmicutes bacterium]|nr:MaoC family dehydratase N-terminal domain-containing protein [Bacillota bacterium]
MSAGALRPRFGDYPVGAAIPPLVRTVTREQIAAYAEASGDRNPIHLDEEFARSVGLDGIIAHGLLSMAFLGTMLTEWLGDPAALRSLSVRFSGVVRPGDTLTCTGEVTAAEVVEGSGGRVGRLRLALTGVNQRGERVLSRGQAVVELPL